MTSCCFRTLFFLIPFFGLGQIVDEVSVQPSYRISWKDQTRWSFNTSLEQRTLLINDLDALHVQVEQFAQYEIGFYSQIGAGIMYRELFDSRLPEELRTMQQFVNARTYNSLKVTHRLRWDQRWRGERLTHRWRYQLSGSIPLSGAVADVSEFYLTGALESIFIAENDQNPDYDQRVSVGIGKKLSEAYQLQLTAEYRWENYTRETERLLFMNLSLFYSL